LSLVVDDPDRLPWALAHGFANLMLVIRGHLRVENVQIIVVVEVENLRDDAHAHPVALTESEVNVYLHRKTFTGTFE
jgi:putative heme iron utilization protein